VALPSRLPEWVPLHLGFKACHHFPPVVLLSHLMVLGPVVLPSLLFPTLVGLVAHLHLILGALPRHLVIQDLLQAVLHRRAVLQSLQGRVACTLTDCE